MATLQFKGKCIIWNHHMSVPYHTLNLDEKLSYKQDKANGNLIIEGDNLPALKSLLPQYTGKIKCIYIDPPYNTGQENWVYNDNVNSPLIKEWFGMEVGKDDLTKHDKWLSMMTPRLKLMRELLSVDGVLFISIDDNELSNLKILLEEIFGEDNFIATIVVQTNPRGRSFDKHFAKTTEYVLVFSRNSGSNSQIYEIKKNEQLLLEYKHSDKDGEYRFLELRNRNPVFTRKNRPNLFFPIYVNPLDNSVSLKKSVEYNVEALPLNSKNEEGCWTWGKSKVEENKKLLVAKKVNTGVWRIYRKDYIPDEGATTKEKVLWLETAMNHEFGKEEMAKLFGTSGSNIPFDFPKSVDYLKKIVNTSTKYDEEHIILDAFAGSGTTAQAVLELNEEDRGNRRFILIQMPENSEKEPKKNICKDITKERVIKVIEKKLSNKEVGFEYKKVGQPIDAETILSGKLPSYEQLAKYVFYLATGQTPKAKDVQEKKYLAGKIGNTEVYLMYQPDIKKLKDIALTFDWAKTTSENNTNKKIVYAPACFIDGEYLEQFNIKFVSIPYNLFEREKEE